MLNEQQRRLLTLAQQDVNLRSLIGPDTLVESYGYVLKLGTNSAVANPLIDGVTQTGIITIQSDAYFVMQYLMTGVVLPPGSIQGSSLMISPAFNIKLQLTDTGSGHELFNQAAPAGLVSGTPTPTAPGVPYLFSIPRVIPPNTNLKIEATQIGTVAVVNPPPRAFWLMINGVKVYV